MASATAPGAAVALLAEFLAHPSIEIVPGHPRAIDALRDQFDPGTEVFVNFLPNGDHSAVVTTAAGVRRAGFVPVPHVAARRIADDVTLRAFLARAAGEAGVDRVLVIAGDGAVPAGAFASSMDLLQSGAFADAGLRSIGVAGHPEGHPLVAADVLDGALAEKLALIAKAGADGFVVTQFAFEAAPIIDWLKRMRGQGTAAPVRIGIAGPASVAALVRFAIRLGVGNSLRTLRIRTNTVGRLLGDARPEDLLHDLGAALAVWPESGVTGLHFFPFGGVAKTGAFIAEALTRLYGQIGRGTGS